MNQQNQQTNEKKHNYFYKITNLINGKYYYGIHSTDNLDDWYLGSGRTIRKAIKKYGKENFSKEIIADYSTRHEASEHERRVVTKELIELDECYNLRTGGDNLTFLSEETKRKISEKHKGVKKTPEHIAKCVAGNLGKKRTEETKNKISKALSGKSKSIDHKRKLSESTKGEKSSWFGKKHSNETKEKMQISNKHLKPMLGKKHTEETKRKMSEATSGKPRKKHSEEYKQHMSNILKNKYKNTSSHRKGCKQSEETRKKISDDQRGEKNHMYGKFGKDSPKYGSKHTEETKRKMSEAQKGKIISDATKLKQKISQNKRDPSTRFRKKCIINNIIYKSSKEASIALNIDIVKIRTRIKSKNNEWKDWGYLIE